MTGILVKKGAIWTQTETGTEGKKCEHTDRRGPCDLSHAFTSQGTLGIANKHHKLGELRKDSLPGAFRKTMALLTP